MDSENSNLQKTLNSELIKQQKEYELMLDYFIRDEFDKLSSSSEEYFHELFISYFKNDIIKNHFNSEKMFLSQTEKTLQYVHENMIEATAEYDFLIKKNDLKKMKLYYAKKGAEFCVIYPVLYNKQDKFYIQRSSGFYSTAATYTDDEFNYNLFQFLSDITTDMTLGLENILTNIKKDGTTSIKKVYELIKKQYIEETDSETSKELARQLINYSQKAGITGDDIPLRKEHYRMLFEI